MELGALIVRVLKMLLSEIVNFPTLAAMVKLLYVNPPPLKNPPLTLLIEMVEVPAFKVVLEAEAIHVIQLIVEAPSVKVLTLPPLIAMRAVTVLPLVSSVP